MELHHRRLGASELKPMLSSYIFLTKRDFLVHTCCDKGSLIMWSYLKDHPIQLPLTTRNGVSVTYSNLEPHLCLERLYSELRVLSLRLLVQELL